MRKVWFCEHRGSRILVTCEVTFNSGLRGGVQRSVNGFEWAHAQQVVKVGHLTYTIEQMNFDIEDLAEREWQS